MQKLTTQNGRGRQKMKILALGANPNKFCIHNLWASRELEMQKLTTQSGGKGQKIKNLVEFGLRAIIFIV